MKRFNAKRSLIKALTVIWFITLPVFLYNLGLILWESYTHAHILEPARDYFRYKAHVTRAEIEKHAIVGFREIENPEHDSLSFFTRRFIKRHRKHKVEMHVIAYYKFHVIKCFEIVYDSNGAALYITGPGEFFHFREIGESGRTIDLTIPPDKRGPM